MHIKDRIKELRRVPANQLLPNPKNWRTHPGAQASALRGLLAEIGYANAVLARETPHGLMLIDGHVRAETNGDGIIPVLVVDVTEHETDLIVAACIREAEVVCLDGDASSVAHVADAASPDYSSRVCQARASPRCVVASRFRCCSHAVAIHKSSLRATTHRRLGLLDTPYISMNNPA